MPKHSHHTSSRSAEAGPPVPALFLARMQALLGEEYEAFAATYAQPPRAGLRANTLKLAPDELPGLVPFALEPLPWPLAAYLIDGDAQAGRHPFHAAGLYYLQDPSAMVPAALLAPQPGERVLDLSAAPGGKATHLASLLAGTGLLVANEVHPQRARDLAENLERWGARNAAITNETPARLAAAWPAFFDRVLVDAPCSGEGMLRKSPAARAEWAPALVQGCAARQDGILASAAALVRPGGTLAYVTCTFAPEEDEGTVARFLDARSDFDLLAVPARPGFAPGRPDWLPSAQSHPGLRPSGEGPDDRPPGGQARPELQRAVRLWPHLYPGEGHFVALLRRAGDVEEPAPSLRAGELASQARTVRPGRGRTVDHAAGGRLPRPLEALYLAFCAEHLAGVPAELGLRLTGTYLYQVPTGSPPMAGLRCLHPGWWLGEFKKDRFEPSHALALALRPGEARQSLDLDPAGPELRAYLQGLILPSPGLDGWVLVTVAQHGLGWGKRVQGMLKSHYPRGLRRY